MTSPPPSQGSAHPLRPYYQPPDESAFVATAPRFSTSTSTRAGGGGGGHAAPFSSASAPGPAAPRTINRYLSDDDNFVDGLSSGSTADGVADMARALIVSGALQFTSTCLAMPFEVGKLLLQIQWVPKDEVWVQQSLLGANAAGGSERSSGKRRADMAPETEEWQDEQDGNGQGKDFGGEHDELSDEEEADAYFRDLSSQPMRPPTDLNLADTGRKARRTDASGYVMRKSIHDEGTRPEFVMPVVVQGGVWEMIKAVGRGKEGWIGLWKGSLTTFILDISTSTIQPIVSSLLSLFSPSALSPLPLPYSPYPYKTLALLLSSHLITGIIVSPLDLVRTRLIAQSTLPAHRKYMGPLDALRKVLREEGGWKTVYAHPNLLIPTILDFTLRPLLSLAAPLFIEHSLRLEPNSNPVSYALAELAISTFALCVTLPIETVRRRLQLQTRAPWGVRPELLNPGPGTGVAAKGLRTCVETRPQAYAGVVEAIYRILTEETSATPRGRKKGAARAAAEANAEADGETGADQTDESASDNNSLHQSGILARSGHSSLGGLRSLYRGFGMGLAANLVVFMLGLVSGEGRQAGWAEI